MFKTYQIKNSLNLFDYTIELKEEGITILTGTQRLWKNNGLKNSRCSASKNGLFFIGLLFKEIILEFTGQELVTLIKKAKTKFR